MHHVHVQHGFRAAGARASRAAAARPDRHLVVLAAWIALEHEARQRAVDQDAQQRVRERALVGRPLRAALSVGERPGEHAQQVVAEAAGEQRGEAQQEQRDEPPQSRQLDRCLSPLHGEAR
jgi:hypothetical protein